MNQIQCDVAGCQERERTDGGHCWTEVKHGEISAKGVALEYTIKHVCPKCRAKFFDLFRPVKTNPVQYPDGSCGAPYLTMNLPEVTR